MAPHSLPVAEQQEDQREDRHLEPVRAHLEARNERERQRWVAEWEDNERYLEMLINYVEYTKNLQLGPDFRLNRRRLIKQRAYVYLDKRHHLLDVREEARIKQGLNWAIPEPDNRYQFLADINVKDAQF